MTLYCLCRWPDESAGEGEDWDEWYGAFADAKKRRKQLIKQNPKRDEGDLNIDRYKIKGALSNKIVILAILNRYQIESSYPYPWAEKTTVVDEYVGR